MTQAELHSWLSAHGLTGWTRFHALLNQERAARGMDSIKPGAVRAWIYDARRNPPDWLDATLPAIALRLSSPEIAHVYTVTLAVSAPDRAAIEAAAGEDQLAPELWLSERLITALEDEKIIAGG